MKPNVGLLDRYIRLTTGLMVLGAGTQMKRGSTLIRGSMLAFGAMKVAEGITGFCPVMYACGASTVGSNQSQTEQSQGSKKQSSSSHDEDKENPSDTKNRNEQSRSVAEKVQSEGESSSRSSAALNEAYSVGSENKQDAKSDERNNSVHT